MTDNRLSSKGFTIVEILVAVGIFALIALAMIDLFISNNALIKSEEATIDVVGTASKVAGEVQTYAMQADAVVLSHDFSGVTYTSGTSTLILELPAIDGSGSIVGSEYDYIVFYSASSSAYRIINTSLSSARAGGKRLLGDSLDSLTFTYDALNPMDATKIEVDVQTAKQTGKRNSQTHVRQQIYLRNH